MTDAQTILYEGMFLFPAAADASAADHLREILGRAEAEVLVLKKWDDRRLAYSIDGQKRGTYFLTYFYARPAQIANIQRDVTLSEQVLRALILKGDYLGETELDLAKKDAEVTIEAKPPERKSNTTETEPAAETPDVAVDVVSEPTEPSAEENDSPAVNTQV